MIREIRTRRSTRKYKADKVDDSIIVQLIEAGRIAPSGSNSQPWHFIVVKKEEMRNKLAELSHQQKWMKEAPVHIVCIGDLRARIKNDELIRIDENSPQMEVKQIIRDTAIAVEHMVLEAEHLGLATCWVAWFEQDEIRPVLNIPADKFVVCILTVGYANETPKEKSRKQMEELLHNEVW